MDGVVQHAEVVEVVNGYGVGMRLAVKPGMCGKLVIDSFKKAECMVVAVKCTDYDFFCVRQVFIDGGEQADDFATRATSEVEERELLSAGPRACMLFEVGGIEAASLSITAREVSTEVTEDVVPVPVYDGQVCA